MSRYITMCNSKDCPVHETCYRYSEFQKVLQDDNIQWVSTTMIDYHHCKQQVYWRIEK